MNKPTPVATISSIGVNKKGDAVLYVVVDGRLMEVSTNVVGFAHLAAAGVTVTNGRT